MSTYVTNHGNIRVRKRCGLPRKAVEDNAERAFNNGLKHTDCSGRLKNYFTWMYMKEKTGNNIRIYNDYVYVFCGQNLVTVIPLPVEHRGAARRLLAKRKEMEEEGA